MSSFWKVCSFLCTQYLVGPPFAWITASMRRGMEVISLWHCSGVMEAPVALIAVFRSSALLGLVSLVFLLTIFHRLSIGFRSVEFAGQSSTVTPWPLNQLLVLWQCGQVSSPAGKWNQHLHKACQQKEAWSALKCPGRWLGWSLTVETSHWTSSNMDYVPLHSSSRVQILISKWKAKFTFIWKEDQSSSFSP